MGHSDIDAAVERAMRRELAARDDAPMDYPDDPTAKRDCGDEAECAVCGRPLGRGDEPERPQFCVEHDMDDLRVMADRLDRIQKEERRERYERQIGRRR